MHGTKCEHTSLESFFFYFVHNKNLLSLLIFGSFYLDEILFHFHFTSFISQAMTSIGNAKVSVMLLLCRKLHSDDAKNTERFCSISIFGVFFFAGSPKQVEHFFSMCSLYLYQHDLISRKNTMAKEQTKTRAYAFVNAQLTLNVLAVS